MTDNVVYRIYHAGQATNLQYPTMTEAAMHALVLASNLVGCPPLEIKQEYDPNERWSECSRCRARIKHVHCRTPWHDEGGEG